MQLKSFPHDLTLKLWSPHTTGGEAQLVHTKGLEVPLRENTEPGMASHNILMRLGVALPKLTQEELSCTQRADQV